MAVGCQRNNPTAVPILQENWILTGVQNLATAPPPGLDPRTLASLYTEYSIPVI